MIVGQYLFAFQLGWFRCWGWTDSVATNLLVHTPLPVLLAVMVGLAPQTRLYRTFFLDEIGRDYVRTRAPRASPSRASCSPRDAQRVIPILTNVAVSLPGIFVGSFLIEVFFSIPGLGRSEVLLAVNRSDYPVIQAVTIYLAVITMVVNLPTDVLWAGRPSGGAERACL